MHLDAVAVARDDSEHPAQKEDRSQVAEMGGRQGGKINIFVDSFVCVDTKLVINTSKPGKAPFDFDIGDLRMKDVGPGQPLRFDATLVNPKPVGNIHSTGNSVP